ncbi:cutinase-domain-containing protein [Astrocystis sublimbata]|nr:cutinase-domain-containing protein [Astrocystis sublimbata]
MILKKILIPFLLGLSGPAAAAPSSSNHAARQAWSVGWWSSELQKFGCRPIIFVFAKASLEPGNLGGTIGPNLSDGLKAAFGVTNVATQGVDYYGFIGGNYYPGGAPPWGIYDMQAIVTGAAACKHSKIVVAGYSQGAAIVHRAIEALPLETRERIAGVVTFGDTQTLQDRGRIEGFPANKTLIICNNGDIICAGWMVPVYPVHWDYVKWVPTATLFLAQRVLAANAVDPWPNGTLAMNLTDVGELGPGIDEHRPVPTKLVAFPPWPMQTAGV